VLVLVVLSCSCSPSSSLVVLAGGTLFAHMWATVRAYMCVYDCVWCVCAYYFFGIEKIDRFYL
jgi:hypothetical protein